MNIVKPSQVGRVVFPYKLRQQQNIKEGEVLCCESRSAELVLCTKAARNKPAELFFKEWFPVEQGYSLNDELFDERRARVKKKQQALEFNADRVLLDLELPVKVVNLRQNT